MRGAQTPLSADIDSQLPAPSPARSGALPASGARSAPQSQPRCWLTLPFHIPRQLPPVRSERQPCSAWPQDMRRLRTQAGSDQFGFRPRLTHALARRAMVRRMQLRLLPCRFPWQASCQASRLQNPLPCRDEMCGAEPRRGRGGLRQPAGIPIVRKSCDIARHHSSMYRSSAAADAVPNRYVLCQARRPPGRMTALLPCRDPTSAAARVRRPDLLSAADPWPSLLQAGLSQSHFCGSSMPQSPGRNLTLQHVHPARQKTSPDGSATTAPALDTTEARRTSE